MHSTKSVAVEEPTCPLMIDGTKIVVERASPSGLVDYTYANENEWAERLPKMIQRAVIEHFKSDYWPGVSAQAASQQSDYRVSIDLRKFQITMPGNVEVSANVTLHNVLEGRAIASQTYNYKVLATPTMSGYMLAFDQATGMLLKDITVMFKNNGVGEIR